MKISKITRTTITTTSQQEQKQQKPQQQKTRAKTHITLLLSSFGSPFLQKPKREVNSGGKLKEPQNSYLLGPFCNMAFPINWLPPAFPENAVNNWGFNRFKKMKCLGPKRCNYFLPKPHKKECEHDGVFDLWPLSYFDPSPPLKQRRQTTCFVVVLSPPSYNLAPTSTNDHHNQQNGKGDGYHPLFKFLFCLFLFFPIFSSSPCFSSCPVFLDIPKLKMCPYGDASGIYG